MFKPRFFCMALQNMCKQRTGTHAATYDRVVQFLLSVLLLLSDGDFVLSVCCLFLTLLNTGWGQKHFIDLIAHIPT